MHEQTRNPDTSLPEGQFREQVRDALGLPWDTRDAKIFAELRRLVRADEEERHLEALDESLQPAAEAQQ